ncbi:hypothetical protein ABZT00_32935, partial [Streptomyces sp. NPDC005486]
MSQPCTPPEQSGADDPRAAALAEGRPFVRGGGALPSGRSISAASKGRPPSPSRGPAGRSTSSAV